MLGWWGEENLESGIITLENFNYLNETVSWLKAHNEIYFMSINRNARGLTASGDATSRVPSKKALGARGRRAGSGQPPAVRVSAQGGLLTAAQAHGWTRLVHGPGRFHPARESSAQRSHWAARGFSLGAVAACWLPQHFHSQGLTWQETFCTNSDSGSASCGI